MEGLGPNNETGLCTADKGTWPGAAGYPDGGPGASPQHVCRYNYNGTISDRDLVEYYLPAWHAIFTRGQAHGMMCRCVANARGAARERSGIPHPPWGCLPFSPSPSRPQLQRSQWGPLVRQPLGDDGAGAQAVGV